MWLLSIAFALCFHSAPARAEGPGAQEDAAARAAFEQGRTAYEAGQFADALRGYERSFELSQRPELLYNIGRAAEADGVWDRAQSAYEAYLRALPAAENSDFVRARLERVRTLREPSMSARSDSAPLPSIALTTGPDPAPQPWTAPPTRRDDRSDRPLWKRGWFWGTVGVLVAGGVTAAILATRDSGPSRANADLHVTQPLEMR
ncbi:MAG TPA: hypothetical protein VFX59_05440 [Polyangiales bacterium]|nr:hypothetical protein [Polyangiales bacterium]